MGLDRSDSPRDAHTASATALFPLFILKTLPPGLVKGRVICFKRLWARNRNKITFLWGVLKFLTRERSQPPAAASWNCSAALVVRKGWSVCSTFFFVIRVSFKTYNKRCCQEIFFCLASGRCCSIWENRALCYWFGEQLIFQFDSKIEKSSGKKVWPGSLRNIIYLGKTTKRIVPFSVKYFIPSQMKCFALVRKARKIKIREGEIHKHCFNLLLEDYGPSNGWKRSHPPSSTKPSPHTAPETQHHKNGPHWLLFLNVLGTSFQLLGEAGTSAKRFMLFRCLLAIQMFIYFSLLISACEHGWSDKERVPVLNEYFFSHLSNQSTPWYAESCHVT